MTDNEWFKYYADHYENSISYRDAYAETKKMFEEGDFPDLAKGEIIERCNRQIYDWQDVADMWAKYARSFGCYLV